MLSHPGVDAREKARRQWEQFSPSCPEINPKGSLALLVDDGIATGMTMAIAAQAQRFRLRFEDTLGNLEHETNGRELVRRNTDSGLQQEHHRRPKSARSSSLSDMDASLAYGELPPPLPLRKKPDDLELRNKDQALTKG